GLVLGAAADAAGVHHEKVGLVGVRGDFHAALLEHGAHEVGVVLVHLAAVGRQEVFGGGTLLHGCGGTHEIDLALRRTRTSYSYLVLEKTSTIEYEYEVRVGVRRELPLEPITCSSP